MSRLHQSILCLTAAIVAWTAYAQAPAAPKNSPAGSTKISRSTKSAQSPVDFFRQLLAMSPDAQLKSLTNRSPEARARILAKVEEYQTLDPDERELRLRATELRWWLVPLLRLPPAKREAQLSAVPDNLRPLVKARLEGWTILPPQLQDEILNNEKALHYFALVETNNPTAATGQQHQIANQFSQFFELTPEEKEQTLNTLSAAERAQMQETLQSFDKLPAQQRSTCLRNYAKFASMSEAERAEFLKNAASWSKMSPKERQTWRDLVENVPLWPPLPPGLDPSNAISAEEPPLPAPNVATNLN